MWGWKVECFDLNYNFWWRSTFHLRIQSHPQENAFIIPNPFEAPGTYLELEKQRHKQGNRKTQDVFKKQRHNPIRHPSFHSALLLQLELTLLRRRRLIMKAFFFSRNFLFKVSVSAHAKLRCEMMLDGTWGGRKWEREPDLVERWQYGLSKKKYINNKEISFQWT